MDEQNQAPRPPYDPQANNQPPEGESASMSPSEIEPATATNRPIGGIPAPVPMDSGVNRTEQTVQSPAVKRRKLPIIALGAALVVVFLAAGSAFAYTWYQNPDRVILDGLSKALQAKTLSYTGSVTLSNGTDESKPSMKLDIKGAVAGGNADVDVKATITQDTQKFEINGKGIFAEDGTLYVQFKDLKKLLDSYLQDNPELQLPEDSMPLVDKLLEKVDGQWIKISPSDFEDYSSEAKTTMTCIQDASASFRNDENIRKELAKVYEQHPFIRVEDNLGTKDGSVGYVISADEEKQKAFWIGTKETTLYKKLVDCDDSFKIDDQAFEPDDTIKSERTEIWLSQWQHEITRINVRTEDEDGSVSQASVVPRFNEEISIKAPSGAKTVTELQDDIQAIVMEYMMSQSGSDIEMPSDDLLSQPL